MKQIVTERPPSNVKHVEDPMYTSDFYGVSVRIMEGSTEVGRGFITTETYEGEYALRSTSYLTVGNGWGHVKGGKDLKAFIKALIADRNQVYVFGTFRELADWLNREE